MINYQLPVWNGVKEKQIGVVHNLLIDYSLDKGVYKQKKKRIVEYEKDYEHMTPLKGSKYIERLRKGKIDWILDYSKNYNSILEIGGGDSFNYRFLDCNKYTIIDPAINQEHKDNKLNLISDYFENVKLNSKYNLILLLSVLEHVDDPNLILEKSENVLDKDGVIFIYIPIIDNQFALGDFNSLIHEHLNYFTFIGAKFFFAKHNLIIDGYYQENDGGFFRLVKGECKINDFSNYDLNKVSYTFDYHFNSFLDLINSEEKILFYGATNGLNNLFQLAKVVTHIDFEKYRITDSDNNKWGKFISSHPLPILPVETLKNYKTICISANSYYREIVASLPKDKIIISTV